MLGRKHNVTVSVIDNHPILTCNGSWTAKNKILDFETIPIWSVKWDRYRANFIKAKVGCWDYLHAGFNRAGIPTKRRQTLFSGTLRGGPYAPAELLEPGDWLYYVNHSYNDIEHSGVFIGWTDYERRQGLILSYAGEGRGEPGRYKVYD